jgi:hypothetical protein
MELIFTILAGLGAFLIIIGYLGFVFAGFRHHFVTGIISTLPVLNIVTLPALWPKAGKKVITSVVGIIIITASWFLGANTGIQKYLGILKNNKQTTPTTITTTNNNTLNIPNSSSSQVVPVVATLATNYQQTNNENEMQQLPKKALYKMMFEVIPVENIQNLKNRVVRIITTNNDQLEGRITNITTSSIFIQNSELPIANIKKISLMVKKAN